MGQNVCYGEERPIVCYCTQEEKCNFERFTQNGCYGNQPRLLKCFTALTPTLPAQALEKYSGMATKYKYYTEQFHATEFQFHATE